MAKQGGRTDLAHLYFSSSGRLGRIPFLLALAPVAGVFAAYDLSVGQPVRALTAWAVFLVLLFVASCLLSKRLHDLGRSGWWTAVVLGLFLAAWPRPSNLFDQAAVGLLGLATAVLILAPGQKGANRFGPVPGPTVR